MATPLLVRVDNRLVHGQILAGWVPHLDARSICVLDDEAARNALVRSAMAIAVGSGLALSVRPVAEAARAVEGRRVLVLLRDVADAVRARAAGLDLRALNVGNVHAMAGRRQITPSVYLSESELGALTDLERAGVLVELRALPHDPPVSLDQARIAFARAAPAP